MSQRNRGHISSPHRLKRIPREFAPRNAYALPSIQRQIQVVCSSALITACPRLISRYPTVESARKGCHLLQSLNRVAMAQPRASFVNVTRASQLGNSSSGKTPGPIYKPRMDFDSTFPAQARVPFGTAPRFGKSSKHDGPGPGAYPLPAPRGPAFSLRFREKFGAATFTSARDNPAPGHVTRLETVQTRKHNAPSFSLRGRRQLAKQSDFTPAPGHTQEVKSSVMSSMDSTKPNQPGIKFASRPTDKSSSSTGDIGPGEYDVAKGQFLLTGARRPPAYSLKGRPKSRAAERVQPEFHVDASQWQRSMPVSTLRTAPAFSMSSRTRFGDPYAQ